ncbi:MAG: hypothetical protein NTY38_23195 [Acidobacteria bacterium]|nr:hypothetical protein [Acidobacteriota bacterium]
MPALPLLLLFALTVKTDGVALRAGCSEDDPEVARLSAGLPVTVKFAISGESVPCYKISTVMEGRTLEGYVAASALANSEEFDGLRRTARTIDLPDTLTAPVRAGASGAGGADAVEMILKNQPAQALESLERQLRTRPKDSRLLALAGFAAYRADDATRATEYWRRSLDVHPDPEIEHIYLKVKREMDADRSSRRTYGSRFLVRYDDADVSADLARTMVQALEEEYSRIAGELGCSAQERIAVIVQSREAYLKTTEAAEWSGGQYDGRIHVALFEKNSIGPLTRRTFAHELVHACLADFSQIPAWLNEGLAQRLSGESTAPGRREMLKALIREKRAPALANMSQSWSTLNGESAAVAYALSLEAVNLIYEQYSYYGIRNIVRNPDLVRKLTGELDRRLRL